MYQAAAASEVASIGWPGCNKVSWRPLQRSAIAPGLQPSQHNVFIRGRIRRSKDAHQQPTRHLFPLSSNSSLLSPARVTHRVRSSGANLDLLVIAAAGRAFTSSHCIPALQTGDGIRRFESIGYRKPAHPPWRAEGTKNATLAYVHNLAHALMPAASPSVS